MTDYTTTSARAMIVGLHISIWNAQRFDRTASDELTDQKQADRDSARVNKHLFGTRRRSRHLAPEFAAMHDASAKLYAFHVANTLPWDDRGERLLPVANYFQYTEGLRARRANLEKAVTTFAGQYPRLRIEAKDRLGDLYKEEDFIGLDKVISRFSCEMTFKPVPAAGDIRVDLPADQLEAIEALIADRIAVATATAMSDAWRRLREAVERVRKATRPDGVVRGSLIENVQEIVDVLARLNVAEDGDLEVMRQRVERELTTVSVADLRENEAIRAETARKAEDIMAAMGVFYAPVAEEVLV